MHEWTIGESLVRQAMEVVQTRARGQGRVVRTTVVAGRLRQIVPELLQDIYRLLVRGTSLDGSILDVRVAPVTIRCCRCACQEALGSPTVFRCPHCRSGDVELVGGRELFLESVEVEADPPTDSV